MYLSWCGMMTNRNCGGFVYYVILWHLEFLDHFLLCRMYYYSFLRILKLGCFHMRTLLYIFVICNSCVSGLSWGCLVYDICMIFVWYLCLLISLVCFYGFSNECLWCIPFLVIIWILFGIYLFLFCWSVINSSVEFNSKPCLE